MYKQLTVVFDDCIVTLEFESIPPNVYAVFMRDIFVNERQAEYDGMKLIMHRSLNHGKEWQYNNQ